MPVRRIRSSDLATGATNQRTTGRGSVTRPAVARDAVGSVQVAGGAVNPGHMGRQATDEPNVRPALIPRESFGWTQLPERTAIVAGRTNGYTVRRGGRPRIIVSVTAALTTAGEIALYKNDVSFETWMANSTLPGPWVISIPTGSTGVIVDEVFDIQFRELDIADHEVTNAGEGGEGLTVEWWFG
jgi:hypothetical protein